MEEELSFFMSALGCMSTKTLQLEGLYKMRSTAVASLKNLNKEEKQLWRLFSRLNRSWQQHGSMHQYKCSLSLQVNWYEDNSLSSHQGGCEIHFNCQLIVKQTLFCYGNVTSSIGDQPTIPLPTRAGRDGQQYPYNPSDPNHLSRFVIGFRGYFRCGGTDHWNWSKCLVGDSKDGEVVENFIRN